jgi:hypothetical protein
MTQWKQLHELWIPSSSSSSITTNFTVFKKYVTMYMYYLRHKEDTFLPGDEQTKFDYFDKFLPIAQGIHLDAQQFRNVVQSIFQDHRVRQDTRALTTKVVNEYTQGFKDQLKRTPTIAHQCHNFVTNNIHNRCSP